MHKSTNLCLWIFNIKNYVNILIVVMYLLHIDEHNYISDKNIKTLMLGFTFIYFN